MLSNNTGILVCLSSEFPNSIGKTEKDPNKVCREKHRELGNFVKTHGILCAYIVLNSLIRKTKDIGYLQ